MDLGLGQVGADGAMGQDPAVEEQLALPHPQPRAGHPAHHQRSAGLGVQVGHQVVGREREGVADHQADAGPVWREPVTAEGAAAGRPHEIHGERIDRAYLGREPQRNGGLGLHLADPAHDRLRHAADERERAGLLSDRREQGRCRVMEVSGGDQDPERRRAVPQRRAGHRGGPMPGLARIRAQHQGCASLHETRLCGDPAGGPGAVQPDALSGGKSEAGSTVNPTARSPATAMMARISRCVGASSALV